MKRLLSLVVVGAAVAASYALVGALNPAVPAQTWVTAGNMADVRSGAAGALLLDGRVLITGGVTASGVTASAERYSPAAWGFVATPSMDMARASHTATLLVDGRVLVTGGTGGDGQILSTAELFDPATNAWTPAGALNVPRRGHTATRLADGRVLIAGGDMGAQPTAALEIFDPATSIFTILNLTLSAPRMLHAAALLDDGRVLIAGGFDGQDALASTDVYDPPTGTLSAGPAMSAARAGLSATTLLDRRVLLVGGTSAGGDLASAEIFDPRSNAIAATDNGLSFGRQGHLAFLLPHNNQVLVVGGTAAGAAAPAAELYTPWEGTSGRFCATGGVNGGGICESGYVAPGPPAVAREWATGAALSFPAGKAWRSGPHDGALLLTGGADGRSAEIYGFATIHTDKDDYTPGSTVTIFGSGWQPGETVALVLQEEPLLDRHPLVSVTADADGNILSTEFSPDEHDLDVRFYLTAYGVTSQAQTTFTDGKPNDVTVSTQLPVVPIVAGNTATFDLLVRFNGTFNAANPSCTAALSLSGTLPAGTGFSFSPSSVTSTSGDVPATLAITTTANVTPTGTTSFTVTATSGAGCQTGSASGTGSLSVAGQPTATAVTSHLPASSVTGQPITVGVSVNALAGAVAPTGSVSITSSLGGSCSAALSSGGGTTSTGSCALTPTQAGAGTLTASYGGTSFFQASVGTAARSVSPAGTNTTITNASALSTATVVGQSYAVNFAVAPVAPGTGAPSGSVTVSDGSATCLGTVADGTCTLTSTSAGTKTITAVYAGNANYSTSTSAGTPHTVNPAATTTTITNAVALATATVVGQAYAVNFTVAVTAPGAGTASGTVTVSDGTSNCSATLPSTSCSLVSLTAGAKSVTASYNGDANFAASTSAGVGHTVNRASTAITITADSPDPSIPGEAVSVTFAVTVNAPGGGTPGGAVTVTDGVDSCVTTVTAGFCSVALTTGGSRPITAILAGDSNYIGSTSAAVPHTVQQPPAITSADHTTFTVGAASSFNVTATGSPAPTFTLTGTLPAGVTFTAAGVLSGTPAVGTGGTYAVTITAANGVPPAATQSFTLTVHEAPAITSAASTTFRIDTAGTFTVTATGFPLPSLTESGSLPAGVSFVDNGNGTATLAGTPAATGIFALTFTATNGVGVSATQSFTLTVGQAPAITSPATTTFVVNSPGSFTAAATGFPAPNFSHAGALPSGVTFTSAGLLSGTPALGSVGSYPITITASNGIGSDATQNFTLVVGKLIPTFSGLTASQSITYGTASIALSGAVDGSATIGGSVTITIAGTTVGPLALADGSNVFAAAAFDTHALAVGGSPYVITYNYSGDENAQPATDVSTSLTVTRKAASVTANSRSKTYGEAITFDGTNFTSDGFINGDAVATVTLTSAGAADSASVVGGPYPIVASDAVGGGLGNYNIQYHDGSLAVSPRPASVTPAAATKIYGEDDPTLTGALNGFLAADGVTATYTRTGGESVAGSPYTISATLSPAGVLSNYSINYGQANFSITRRGVTVAADPQTKVYGEDDPALTYHIMLGSLAFTDTFSGALTRQPGDGVGTYAILVGSLELNANYTLTFTGAALTVTVRPVTVTADPQTKVYGTGDPALTYRITSGSLVFGETFTGALVRDAGQSVGGYAIRQGSLALNANYLLSFVNGTLTITPRPVTVTADAKTKVLAAADPAFTHQVTSGSLVTGDSFSGALTRLAGETVGAYPIQQGTLTLGPNYMLTFVGANLSIVYSIGACLGQSGHTILQPINADGTSVVKKNSTVPAKFRVCDANGTSIGAPGTVSDFRIVQVINGTASTTANEIPESTTPDAAFRWDPVDRQWIFNINTKDQYLQVGKTYGFAISLNDGSQIVFRFGLR